MKYVQHMWQTVKKTVMKKFKSVTITFLIIMLITNGFRMLFGAENMVLGIIIAPMMLIFMARDMTAHPVRNLLRQALILCVMAAAACFSMLVPVPIALLIHLAVAFFLLYSYTCDCGDHMYFQYILSYLLLIFMGPISLQQLPLRLLGMITGAGCILLYQFIKGRDRIRTATSNALLILLEDTKIRIDSLLCGNELSRDNANLRNALKMFSQTIEHRRKATLELSDASIAAVEAVLSLKKFNSALHSPYFVLTEERLVLLRSVLPWLDHIRDFVLQERDDIPCIQIDMSEDEVYDDAESLYQWTNNLHTVFLAMRCPENRRRFRKTGVSTWGRLKIAINFSPMRATYALRVSCLLAMGILLVQNLHLEHGKWLLFTIASVSLPYSDEVRPKAKKRFFATLIGGAVSLIVFSLIPSAAGKTAVMLASGYLSCYMTDYLRNFSCATVGALGGAVIAMTSTGFAPVGGMVLTRIIYIAAGIIIAVVFNCLIFPINRERATRHLAHKYNRITQTVSESYQSCQPDLQLRYHLLLLMYRLEEKLMQNAEELQWDDVHSFLISHQTEVWQAKNTFASPLSVLS